MPTTPNWKGSTAIIEMPGSPDWRIRGEGTRIQRRFEGPYTAIKSAVDAGTYDLGETMSDIGDDYPIKDVRFFQTGEGGVGELSITLDDFTTLPNDATPGGEDNSKIEFESVQLEKSITEHPFFADTLSADAINTIVQAAEAGEPLPDFSSSGGQTKATGLYNRLRAGVESYIVFAPLVRKTTPLGAKPDDLEAGIREDPPEEPGGTWQYLKTADRAVSPGQDSAWDRIEEWTGADVWDPILYPEP